jgi:hypothetical protein
MLERFKGSTTSGTTLNDVAISVLRPRSPRGKQAGVGAIARPVEALNDSYSAKGLREARVSESGKIFRARITFGYLRALYEPFVLTFRDP